MGWFPAYLLELLHVDIELTAQFSLGMRKRRNLRAQGTATGGFILGSTALFFVFGSEALYFCIFTA